jgi:hypothetical protein
MSRGSVVLFALISSHFLAAPAASFTVVERDLLVLLGEAANDHMGTAVAVGDIDGNGFDDIVSGAWGNDAAGSNAGRVYVHHGAPDADAVADLTLTAEAAGDHFGIAVAVGDVNGDGFDDVIVGAELNDAGGTQAGRAYVFFGGLGADGTPDLVLTGEAERDFFGGSVASVDFDRDGYADVVVGAYNHDGGSPVGDRGRVYIFRGGPGANAIADYVLTGDTDGGRLGASLAGAGDVNGDGYDDLIVGESPYSTGVIGRAFLLFGGPAADAVVDLTLYGQAPGDGFGITVAGAGDVNGDGFDDVLVSHGLGSRVTLFLGGSPPNASSDLTIVSADVGGERVSRGFAIGDVDLDGYDDFALSTLQTISTIGRLHVFRGAATLEGTPDLSMSGESAGDFYGHAVASGNFEGAAFPELVVGAPAANRSHVHALGPATLPGPANAGLAALGLGLAAAGGLWLWRRCRKPVVARST